MDENDAQRPGEEAPQEGGPSGSYFSEEPEPPGTRYAPPTPGKPTGGLMAMGVITIVACSLFTLLSCCGVGSILALPVMQNMPGAAQNPSMGMYKSMQDDTLVMANGVISSGVMMVLFVIGIVAGVGIVRLRAWGRRLAIVFSLCLIGFWVVQQAFNLLVVQPRVAEIMTGVPGAELAQNPLLQVGGVGVGFLCYNILPVALLIVLNTRSVKQQFALAAQLPEAGHGA